MVVAHCLELSRTRNSPMRPGTIARKERRVRCSSGRRCSAPSKGTRKAMPPAVPEAVPSTMSAEWKAT
eukprot:2323722-Pyramimonas_sp.AAC.1